MSKQLSAAASEEFDSEVKHAYQRVSNLRQAVTFRGSVVGGTYHFRKMGKGLANQKSSSDDVTPMDVSHTKIPCVLQDWNAPEYTDIFDDAEVNFEERTELAETIAMALGRREDQLVIDAMIAGTPTTNAVASSVGGANTNLNVAKLRAGKRELDKKGVPNRDRHIAHSAEGLEGLLGETETTSSDYNTVKALVQGEIDTFMGFKFHGIEDRDEGGLPISSGDRTTLAWHKQAIGLAVGIDLQTSVDWVPQKTSWLSNGLLKANSAVRDTDGYVKITTDENG